MKKCASCGEVKTVDEFHENKSRKDGIAHYCKKCCAELHKKRARTLRGKCLQIYVNQKKISKLRRHHPPTYTKREFIEWMLSNEDYIKLFNEWKESGFKKEFAPSCDRLDDYKGYSFDNIRVVTWRENQKKGDLDRVNGINNKGSKAVIKCNLIGVELDSYHSINHAARETDIKQSCIWGACSGKQKTAGGFKWKYAEHT